MKPEQRQRIREAAKLAAKQSAKQVPGCLRDLGSLAGAAAIVYGVAQYSMPAAWITAGLALVALSTVASLAASRVKRKKNPNDQ